MTSQLDPVTKSLLNSYFKSQPALNKPGVPAAFSGVLLGDLIDSALVGIKPGLDKVTKDLLNLFPRTQPALQRPGVPAASASILLGDIIDSALKKGTIGGTGKSYASAGVGPWTVTVNSVSHGLVTGASVTVANGTDTDVDGVHSITVVDADNFTFSVVADPSASGTLDWSISQTGVAYTSSGAGPYTVAINVVGHGLANGASITVANGSNAAVDGVQVITVVDADNFTFDVAVDPTGPGTLDYSIGAIGASYTSVPASWLVTVTSASHALTSGFTVTISAGTNVAVNGSRVITVVNPNTFTFPLTSDPGAGTLTWSYSSSGLTLSVSDKKILNAFSNTQPALQKAGVPAANSGILLGDLLEAALA